MKGIVGVLIISLSVLTMALVVAMGQIATSNKGGGFWHLQIININSMEVVLWSIPRII